MGKLLIWDQDISICIKEVVDLIIREIGCDPKIPLWEALSDREDEPAVWYSNNSKALNLLGWKPNTPLNDGLKKTITWMRDNIHFYEGKIKL